MLNEMKVGYFIFSFLLFKTFIVRVSLTITLKQLTLKNYNN